MSGLLGVSWSGARRVGAPQGGALKGLAQTQRKLGNELWAPKVGVPKISRLFFPLPHPRSLFLSLSVCLLLEFCGFCEDRDAQMCTLGLSGCRVEPRRPHQTGPPGLHTTAREPKRVHLRVLALQTSPKFHEKTQRERENSVIFGRSGGELSGGGASRLQGGWGLRRGRDR